GDCRKGIPPGTGGNPRTRAARAAPAWMRNAPPSGGDAFRRTASGPDHDGFGPGHVHDGGRLEALAAGIDDRIELLADALDDLVGLVQGVRLAGQDQAGAQHRLAERLEDAE